MVHTATFKKCKRRSVTLDLGLVKGNSVDPGPALLVGPVVALANVVWEEWLPRHQIWRSWGEAVRKTQPVQGNNRPP